MYINYTCTKDANECCLPVAHVPLFDDDKISLTCHKLTVL